RPVLNEEQLQAGLLHHRKRRETSFTHTLAQKLRCSSECARSAALGFLPILSWLPSYPLRSFLFHDVVSGLSTGVVQLPQGLAYAMLAAVPAVYGLYSSFYPVFLYTFFGTSRHISVGTFAVMSLMIGGVVVREAPDAMFPATNSSNSSTVDLEARDAHRVQVAVALTTLVGLIQVRTLALTPDPIQLLLGMLRLGVVSIYLTEPLVRGTNVATVTVGVACMVFLYGVKQLNERCKARMPVPLPGEIIVVIVATATSYGLGLADNYQVDVVGPIPTGLLPNLVADAFAVAIVGFSMAVSMAKTFALKHGYSVDGNQVEGCPGVKIFHFNSSIYFANCDLYLTSLKDKTQVNPTTLVAQQKLQANKQKKTQQDPTDPSGTPVLGVTHELLSWSQEGPLRNGSTVELRAPGVHTLILDWSPVNFVDTVGAKAITSMIKDCAAVDIQVLIAGCNRTLLSQLETLQFFSGVVTPNIMFPTIHDAVLHSRRPGASQSQPTPPPNGVMGASQ
ncbi:hypothetical protein CRUP_013341, partial [Coryphaenoides rupestris]